MKPTQIQYEIAKFVVAREQAKEQAEKLLDLREALDGDELFYLEEAIQALDIATFRKTRRVSENRSFGSSLPIDEIDIILGYECD